MPQASSQRSSRTETTTTLEFCFCRRTATATCETDRQTEEEQYSSRWMRRKRRRGGQSSTIFVLFSSDPTYYLLTYPSSSSLERRLWLVCSVRKMLFYLFRSYLKGYVGRVCLIFYRDQNLSGSSRRKYNYFVLPHTSEISAAAGRQIPVAC